MEQFNSPIQGYDGWNINRSYMTPAYMANFRPSYGAGESSNSYTDRRTVGQSLWRLGPGDHAYGRDVLQDSEQDRYNISTSAGDAAAVALQQVAIPAAAWYGFNKLNNATGFGKFAGRSAARGATGLLGRGATALGMGRLAAMGGPAAAGLASVGGFAGGMFLPLMAAQAASSIADSALIDPYVATRRGMDATLANNARTYVSGTGGATSSGFGMSATRAQSISQALTVAGQKDLMLTGGDYNEIADNMMRAGIFQEVGDMDTQKVVDGVKKATSVLKMIQRITGDPDIKNGIQTLATLKAGGLDDIQAMGLAVDRLRGSAAASGVSVTQIMDTIGNQGAVMAQREGISSTTGLLASADAFAGFTNARRAGLISGTEASMLGGTEGMTQNLLGGAYQVMNTGIARMAMQGGGRFGAGVSSNLSRWGSTSAGNPLASQGDWYLNQQVYKDKMLNTEGPTGMIIKALQDQASLMGLDPNDGSMLASIAPSLGISPEQLRAAGIADRSSQNPRASMNRAGANRASMISNRVTELQNSNQGLRGIWGLGTAQRAWNEGSREVLGAGANAMSPFTSIPAAISDAWSSSIVKLKGIEDVADQASFIDGANGRSRVRYRGRESITTTDMQSGYGAGSGKASTTTKTYNTKKYNDLLARMNNAEYGNDPEIRTKANAMRKALSEGNTEEASRLFVEIDNKMNGYLTGTAENDFERRVAQKKVAQDFSSGNIVTEVDMTLSSKAPGKTMKGELSAIRRMDPKEQDKALKRLIRDRKSDLVSELGILPSQVGNKSSDEVDKLLLDKARSYDLRYDEINTGSEATDKEAFMKRFQDMGYSDTQINSMINKSSRSFKDFLKDQNETWFGDGNVTDQTLKISRQIDESIEADKRADRTKGSNVDWSNIRDVTTGISALGDATDRNTSATNLLTDALIATSNRAGGIFSKDITKESLLTNPKTENAVKGVGKNTDVRSYYE